MIVLPIQSCWSSHSDTSSTSRPRSSGYFPSSHGPSPPASSPSGESSKPVDFFTAIKNREVLTLVVILSLLCSGLASVLIAISCFKYCPDRGERCCFDYAICKNCIGRGSGGHTDNTEMLVVGGGQAVSLNLEQLFHPERRAEGLWRTTKILFFKQIIGINVFTPKVPKVCHFSFFISYFFHSNLTWLTFPFLFFLS